MNKKLVAAAVAAGLAAPFAAQAEITVYSHIQFEIVDTDPEGGTSEMTVTDRERGRLGIKGGHDLGGGLKSFAIAEFDFEGGNRDAEFGSTTRTSKKGGTPAHTHDYTVRNGFRVREINAGLKGSFGSIGLGTVKSAYKYSGGVKYDPFVTTALEARGPGMSGNTFRNGRNKSGGHNGFLNNALIYTNKFGMANVHFTYSPDDTDVDNDGDTDAGEMTLGLKFGDKNWEAGVAMYDEGTSAANCDSAVAAIPVTATLSQAADTVARNCNQENLKLFGSMKFGNHTIRLQWEDVDLGYTDADAEFIWAGYELKLGKGMINVQYATAELSSIPENGWTMTTIGYIHKFNKQTRVHVGYQTTDVDANAAAFVPEQDELAIGIRVNI